MEIYSIYYGTDYIDRIEENGKLYLYYDTKHLPPRAEDTLRHASPLSYCDGEYFHCLIACIVTAVLGPPCVNKYRKIAYCIKH